MFQRVNIHLWKKELGGKNNYLHILETKKEYDKVYINGSALVHDNLLCLQSNFHCIHNECASLVYRISLSFSVNTSLFVVSIVVMLCCRHSLAANLNLCEHQFPYLFAY
jgi:hypothetical protein